jgi:hypothetical protein
VLSIRGSESERDGGLKRALVPALLYAAGAAVFFRQQWSSGFDLLLGDRGDTRLATYLHEHVYRALLGEGAFLSPPHFHDVTHGLNQTDAFLLNQIFYAPLRMLGAEPMLAQSLTIILLSAVGYLFACLTLRRMRVPMLLAAIAALLVTFPNNLFLKSGHQQHFAVYYLPLVAYLMVSAIAAVHRRPAVAGILGAMAGLIGALVFSTGYYMAWFFGLGLFIFVPVVCRFAWPVVLAWWREGPASIMRAGLVSAAGFAGGLALFLVIYAPLLGRKRSFAEYLSFAPRPRDIFNVGGDNLIWSGLIRTLGLVGEQHLANGELRIAVTPMVAMLLVASFALTLRPGFWGGDRHGIVSRAVVIGCAGVCAMLFLLTVSIDQYSAYWLLYKFVPGAGAIRVGYRAMVISNLFAVTAVALTASRVVALSWAHGAGLRKPLWLAAVLVLLGFCLVEQVNLHNPSLYSRKFEAAHLRQVGAPPDGCDTFYVAHQRDRGFYEIQLDAMMVAQAHRLPTLNGYSDQAPAGWTMYETNKPDYETRMLEWARARGVGPVCRLDVPQGAWTR